MPAAVNPALRAMAKAKLLEAAESNLSLTYEQIGEQCGLPGRTVKYIADELRNKQNPSYEELLVTKQIPATLNSAQLRDACIDENVIIMFVVRMFALDISSM